MAGAGKEGVGPGSTRAGSSATEGESPFWDWLLPSLAFLAGVVFAGAVFFLFFVDDESDDLEAAAAPSPTRTPEPSPTPDELVVQVPAACVEAAEAANAVTRALGDVAGAVRSFDARELQDTLDVVQDLRPDVERVSQECLDIAADARVVTPSPTATPTPLLTPTPTPTASPSA